MATATTPKVATVGVYTDTRGHQKPALVLGTTESVEPGTSAPEVLEGHVHLWFFGFTSVQARFNVPLRETAEANPDYTVDGTLRGFFQPNE